MAEDEAAFLRRRAGAETVCIRRATCREAATAHAKLKAAYLARLAAIDRGAIGNTKPAPRDAASRQVVDLAGP